MVPAQLVDVGSGAKSGWKRLKLNRAVVSKIQPIQKQKLSVIVLAVFVDTVSNALRLVQELKRSNFHVRTPFNEHLAGDISLTWVRDPCPL